MWRRLIHNVALDAILLCLIFSGAAVLVLLAWLVADAVWSLVV